MAYEEGWTEAEVVFDGRKNAAEDAWESACTNGRVEIGGNTLAGFLHKEEKEEWKPRRRRGQKRPRMSRREKEYWKRRREDPSKLPKPKRTVFEEE